MDKYYSALEEESEKHSEEAFTLLLLIRGWRTCILRWRRRASNAQEGRKCNKQKISKRRLLYLGQRIDVYQ